LNLPSLHHKVWFAAYGSVPFLDTYIQIHGTSIHIQNNTYAFRIENTYSLLGAVYENSVEQGYVSASQKAKFLVNNLFIKDEILNTNIMSTAYHLSR